MAKKVSMINPKERFDLFLQEFNKAKQASSSPEEVSLLPVSKGHSAAHIKEFLKLEEFPLQLGENYLNELREKKKALSGDFPQLKWHYTGALQSRKIEEVFLLADCVHGVFRKKELEIIEGLKEKKDFYLQVNISNEPQKSGVFFSSLSSLVTELKSLDLEPWCVGFMAIASDIEIMGAQKVREEMMLLKTFRDQHCPQFKLNMGMSGDYPIALECGSNLVRVGTAIFGPRV